MRRTIFGADHDAFRASVAQFVDRELRQHHDEMMANKAISRHAWLVAGEQGLLGLEVPEKYGGSAAGDYRFNAVLGEELAKLSLAFASAFSIHYDVVAPYLVELTSEEQKQRWLPGFCRGEIMTAIAMTEPSGGTDLAALRTTAVRDRSDWVLNGSKTFVTNGGSADLVVVACSTDPERGARGITLFAVEYGTKGFERGRILDKVGQPESNTSELFFDAVRIPAENMLGELDRGFHHMMERLPQERLGAALENVANARTILDETLVYVHEREAFGRPIGSFQHNKFILAELVTKLDVTQAFVDQCIVAHADRELTAIDAAKAKWWTAEVQNDVLDRCVQLYGGYGYMKEYRVARAWMDARVTKIWAGSNEIMKELIGRDLGL
jgi:alkylation response protein AidB-like acyl-CoA dehydrogenase